MPNLNRKLRSRILLSLLQVYPSEVHVVSIGVPVEDLTSTVGDSVKRQCSVELCGGT